MSLPWPIRSVLAGAAGTAALTLSYTIEHRLRPRVHAALDYDDSLVPGEIVAGIMHLSNVSDREEDELGLALRWGYGSVFGIWHGILRRKFGEPWASAGFGATLMTATLALFPLLGKNAPAVALAPERDRHGLRDARCLRRRRRCSRRSGPMTSGSTGA